MIRQLIKRKTLTKEETKHTSEVAAVTAAIRHHLDEKHGDEKLVFQHGGDISLDTFKIHRTYRYDLKMVETEWKDQASTLAGWIVSTARTENKSPRASEFAPAPVPAPVPAARTWYWDVDEKPIGNLCVRVVELKPIVRSSPSSTATTPSASPSATPRSTVTSVTLTD